MTDKILLTIEQAAERLALSRSTVYELIAAGEIPVVRYGRAVRIKADDLVSWVALRTAR